tara:strand:+ start:288 stop:578 length:291 start_codon:yes stop_codon:yes gene_type:complete
MEKTKKYLDKLIPNFEIMPKFSKAVNFKKFIKKNIRKNKDNFEVSKDLEKKIIEEYFTSSLVQKRLKIRSSKLIKIREANLISLLYKQNKKKIYIK